MTAGSFPWLELTLLAPLLGAGVTAFIKTPAAAARWAIGFILAVSAGALGTAVEFLTADAAAVSSHGTFKADEIAAPMLPVLAVLHLLTLLGTSKSRMTPSFCARLLLSAFATMAAVTSQSGSVLIALMIAAALLPVWDLKSRGRRARGFLFYVVPFIGLLLIGWTFSDGARPVWAVGLLLLALKLCGGIVPLHGWLPTLFQRASFGAAMLFVLPLIEVVASLRLLLPHAPEWMLDAVSIACLVTAVYAAGMAVVQNDARRFYAFLALSQTSMVMFAVMLHTPTSITAALCLWISIILALAGLGYSIRALESRFGSLSLREHHGYYEQAPGLAVIFLVAGLASVGFPGTIGFVPMELLISGSAQHGLGFSVTLAVAAMLNGIAILRAYFSIFTGRRPTTSVSLRETRTERGGIILIALAVFFGGWFSPRVVESRHRVADRLLEARGAVPGKAGH
ncbi:MAG TPA: oxidoreductase [Verrucomicrobiales bacterium]|nr:oxidoreductase [Verrucomicrobiales bacterium]HRJ10714.1 proton-conducting transporter membrane subunit [Prosthecobacter sp.]